MTTLGRITRVEMGHRLSAVLLTIDHGDTLAVINSTFNGFATVDGTVSVKEAVPD